MLVESMLGLLMLTNNYLEKSLNTEMAKYMDDLNLCRILTASD